MPELEDTNQDYAERVEATRKLEKEYRNLAVGEQRDTFWHGLTATEQEALRQNGIAGPADINDGDHEPVTLNRKEIRSMDPAGRAEAEAEFAEAVKAAEQVYQRGLSDIGNGAIDASQDALDEIASLRDEIDATADDTKRGVLVQEAAAAIRSLRGTDPSKVFNSDQIKKTRQYHDSIRNRLMIEETDVNGNKRVMDITREAHPTQFSKGAPKDNFPDNVTPDDFVSWDPSKQRRFIEQRPQDYEALLTSTDS